MYGAILQKNAHFCINEDLLHPVIGCCFIVRFILFCVYGARLYCTVQRCNNISRMGSLEETTLNLKILERTWFVLHFGVLSRVYFKLFT